MGTVETEYRVWVRKEVEVSFVVTAVDEDEAGEKALVMADEQIQVHTVGSRNMDLEDETDSDWELGEVEEA